MSIAIPSPGEVVTNMHNAYRNRDLEAIAAYWAEEIHYIGPGVDAIGKEARVQAERIWLDAFTENSVDVEVTFENGEEVLELCILRGVHTGSLPLADGGVLAPTNRPIAGTFASHYKIVDGKVVYQRVVYDQLSLFQQLQGAV